MKRRGGIMKGPATQPARKYRQPTPEEFEHIIQHHIRVEISTTDGSAFVSVSGECEPEPELERGHKPKCPTVHALFYCKRPPC
jgi:hypothetical protein